MYNISIKQKLLTLAILVSVFLLIIAVLASHSIQQIKDLEDTKVLVKENKIMLLTLRRNEKDFLARLSLKYRGQFENNYQTLSNSILQLQGKVSLMSDVDGNKLRQLLTLLDDYKSDFNRIITLNQQIGLTPDEGLRGQLRSAVHKAETLIKEQNLIALQADMLMLRRNEKDFIMRKAEKYIGTLNNNVQVFQNTIANSRLPKLLERNLLQKINAYHQGFKKLSQNYQVLGLTHESGLHGNMRKTVHKTEAIFEEIDQLISQKVVGDLQQIQTELFVLSSVFILLIILSMFFMAISINRRLLILKRHLADVVVSSGDLSVSLIVTGKDEVADISILFNQFVENLKDTFSQIPIFSENLQIASKNNTNVTQQTFQLAVHQQQESDLLEHSAREMFAGSNEISANIQIAAKNANRASEFVIKGKQEIAQVGGSIDSLAEKLQSSAKIINELEQNSTEINVVLEVISGIAEQTNLLALNAAIEAARAGDNGRGFAVVADEVRNLAKQTKESTIQIHQLVEKFQENVANSVSVMQEGSEGAQQAVIDANSAIHTLDEISESVNQIYSLNSQIADASDEQKLRSDEINKNISVINKTAQDAASQSKEANNSSQSIVDIARELQASVAKYTF